MQKEVESQGNYETRFVLKTWFVDDDKKKPVCSYNLFHPVKYKKQSKNFNQFSDSIENSWEIVEAMNRVSYLFQLYMKELTSDYIEKFQYLYEDTNPSKTAYYLFELIDEYYPVRDENGRETEKITSKVIGESKAWAGDFVQNDNFNPDIFHVWKDFEHNGQTVDGMRTIIKKTLSKTNFTNRFKNSGFIHNFASLNSIDVKNFR